MPRWTTPAKYYYSPERLAYLREANRAYRERLRGGKPPMTPSERGRLGNRVMNANKRARKATEQQAWRKEEEARMKERGAAA